MFKGHIPEIIYEALPYIYAAVGIAMFIAIDHPASRISCLVLLTAAWLVWSMQRRYRKVIQQVARGDNVDLSGLNIEQESTNSLVQIQWKKSFECGQADIDRQHRHLFALGSELINTVSSNKPRGDTELLLDEIINHISDHFCTEEAILARTRHPLSLEHREIHSQLLTKALSLRSKFLDGSLVTSELVGFIVYDVITDHITKEDLKFAVES